MTLFGALLWPWMLQTFGSVGAVLVVCGVIIGGLLGLATPICVWLLYRKSLALERYITELQDFKAQLSRQQIVERLRRDRERQQQASPPIPPSPASPPASRPPRRRRRSRRPRRSPSQSG